MKSPSYEYLSHTAEAKFAAYGKTLEEAFCSAALALENIMVKTATVKAVNKKLFSVKAKNVQALLYDFLQQLLILFDSEGFVLHTVAVKIAEQKGMYTLTATLSGDKANKYEILSGVKSVTYHEMEIVEDKKGWKIVVVVDV